MAEQEPTYTAPKDERDELIKLKEQLERVQFDVDQKEAFGKYDVTAPAEGEDTYQTYLDQRPAEGIVRDGDVYRNSSNGNFGSESAYSAQAGDTQSYYDQLGGIENKGEYQPPNYDNMGVMQLAKEAAAARKLGDVAEEQAVREALVHHLTMDAMKDDSETPAEAQARYEDEVARYESLVDRFISRAEGKTMNTEDVHAHTSGEGQPSERVAFDPEASVSRVFEGAGANGEDELELVSADGEVSRVSVNDLYDKTPADVEEPVETPVEVSEVAEASEEPEETEGAAWAVSSEGEVAPAGEEVEEEEKIEEDEKSKLDRLRDWFKKENAYRKEYGGKAFWANKWDRARAGFNDKVLDRGVTEEMPDDEKEAKRKRNRVFLIAGAGVLAAGAIAAVFYGVNALEGGDVQAGDIPNPSDSAPEPTETPVEVNGADAPAGFEAEVPPVEAAPSSEAFNVPVGGGGEQLFTNLGIEPAKWYANENTLLAQFPGDFYRMSDGHVGIASPGWLSQGAQDFINTLK